MPEAEVEALLVSLILDGRVHGYIDQVISFVRGFFVFARRSPRDLRLLRRDWGYTYLYLYLYII